MSAADSLMVGLAIVGWVLLGGLVCLGAYVALVWAVMRGSWAIEDRAKRRNRERVTR